MADTLISGIFVTGIYGIRDIKTPPNGPSDVLLLDELSIVSEPSLKSAHEGESVERPKDDNSKDPGEVPMATASEVRADICAATMMFEAEHEECIHVLPYEKDGQFVVQFVECKTGMVRSV